MVIENESISSDWKYYQVVAGFCVITEGGKIKVIPYNEYFGNPPHYSHTSNNSEKRKIICYKIGEIIKLSDRRAYISRDYVKRACINGHYDPISQDCIIEMGDIHS